MLRGEKVSGHWVALGIAVPRRERHKGALVWKGDLKRIFFPRHCSSPRAPHLSRWLCYLFSCSSPKYSDSFLPSPLSHTIFNSLADSVSPVCKACPRSVHLPTSVLPRTAMVQATTIFLLDSYTSYGTLSHSKLAP